MQYGEQAASRVRRSIDAYTGVFRRWAGVDWETVCGMAAGYVPAIEAFEARYLDEMRGIADGARVGFNDVLAINVRTEVMFSAKARSAGPGGGECTSIAVRPEAVAGGHTLIGQNWDWLVHARDTVVILEAQQDEGPAFVTLVEAGLLAKFGMNACGIGVATNAMACERDRGEPTVPYHVALRALHDATSISDGLARLQRAPRASSANYVLAQRDGLTLDVEAMPGDFSGLFVLQPDDGLLVHTNHFLSPRFAGRDVGLWLMPDSPFRLQSALAHLRPRMGDLSPATLQEALCLHAGHPVGVCSHPREDIEVAEQEATVVSAVMDLADLRMWIADGNPCETGYRSVDYATFLDGS